MPWRLAGALAFLIFVVVGAGFATTPDGVLEVVLSAAAAASALQVALGRSIRRWVALILLVVPAELALVELLIDIPTDGMEHLGAKPVSRTWFQLGGLGAMVAWAGALLAGRPFRDPTMGDL